LKLIQWLLARAGLYVAVTGVGLLVAALVARIMTGRHGLSGFLGSLNHLQNWLPEFTLVILGLGIYVLCLLTPLAMFSKKLPQAVMKLILLPFLMVPVLLVDLAGSPVWFTLYFLAIQLVYLIIVGFGEVRT
jgi:hypothetical protein